MPLFQGADVAHYNTARSSSALRRLSDAAAKRHTAACLHRHSPWLPCSLVLLISLAMITVRGFLADWLVQTITAHSEQYMTVNGEETRVRRC